MRETLLEYLAKQAELDRIYLARYVVGCGEYEKPHEFDGDPADIYELLYCVRCGMEKKLNFDGSMMGRRREA